MQRYFGLKIIALLAFLQGLAAILRALNWVEVGANLFSEGLLILPLIGVIAILRGLFVSVIALFYVFFAGGALLGSPWARPLGLTAAIINLLIVVSAIMQGADFVQALAWSVIPAILLIYFFLPKGRKGLVSEYR